MTPLFWTQCTNNVLLFMRMNQNVEITRKRKTHLTANTQRVRPEIRLRLTKVCDLFHHEMYNLLDRVITFYLKGVYNLLLSKVCRSWLFFRSQGRMRSMSLSLRSSLGREMTSMTRRCSIRILAWPAVYEDLATGETGHMRTWWHGNSCGTTGPLCTKE